MHGKYNHELCVENVRKRVIRRLINVRPCTITRQGPLYLENRIKFVYGKKIVFVFGICDLLKN